MLDDIPNDDGYISEEVAREALKKLPTKKQGGFPIYLEGQTVIGRGHVSSDGRHIEIDIDSELPIAELMNQNLIGFSTVTLHADRAEEVLNKEKEKTDE